MSDLSDVYLQKAVQSLDGAESEFVNRRFDNCANRCYYSCFQAAIAALMRAGVRPGGSGEWSHAFVPAQFDGLLVTRRKSYSTQLRGILARNYALRQTADYDDDFVTETEAGRALHRTRALVQGIMEQGGAVS